VVRNWEEGRPHAKPPKRKDKAFSDILLCILRVFA
jgi:hypothetical protein